MIPLESAGARFSIMVARMAGPDMNKAINFTHVSGAALARAMYRAAMSAKQDCSESAPARAVRQSAGGVSAYLQGLRKLAKSVIPVCALHTGMLRGAAASTGARPAAAAAAPRL